MIHFVAVAGVPSAIRALFPRLAPSVEASRYFEGDRLEEVGPTWAVAAINARDPLAEQRLVTDEDSMVVVNGPALARAGIQEALMGNLLAEFRSHGSEGAYRCMDGAFNFVGVSPTNGLCAFGDFSGLFPLYWHQGTDHVIVSNRSSTVGKVLGAIQWDVRALAWVIGHPNVCGEDMPVRSVRYVSPGREVRAPWGEGKGEFVPSPAWVWPEPSTDLGRENLTSAEWDAVTDELVQNFRVAATSRPGMSLFLTGGKDSRLCLALTKAAGLQDSVETLTTGKVDSPEVEAAAAVAAAAGFRHRRSGPPVSPPDSPRVTRPMDDPDLVWERLRQHAYRHDAIVCPWDGMAGSLRATMLAIKGFGGELYRGPGGYSRRWRKAKTKTVAVLAAMFDEFHQQPPDPLELLQPDERTRQREWLEAWVYRLSEEVRFDALPEKFYIDYRLGHWNGPMAQFKAGFINVNPLLSTPAAKKNLELALEVRASQRLHYEVMRRTAPELVAIPFLKDRWSPLIAADAPVELPDKPFETAVKVTSRALKSWQWPFLATQGEAMEALFIDAERETDLGSVCDMARLRDCARGSSAIERPVEAKSLLSAVTASLVLLDRAEPVVDEPLAM